MEELYKYLVILAVVIVPILKQLRKNSQQEQDEEREVPPTTYPPLNEQPIEGDKEKTNPVQTSITTPPPFQNKRPKRSSQPAEAAENKTVHTDKESEPADDYGIHSVEEARKAIIWSEILQRKY